MVPTAIKKEKLTRFNHIVAAGYEVRIAERRLKTTVRTLAKWSKELGLPIFNKA
jgi:hypothetical protein